MRAAPLHDIRIEFNLFRPLLKLLSSYLGRFVVALVLLLAGAAAGRAQPIGPSLPLSFKADSLLTSSGAAGAVNELWGNVRITQGVVVIEANKAVVYEATNSAIFTGNVRVTQPGMTLTAPRADYDGNSRLATAPSGVTLQEEGATLQAGYGTYNMYNRHAQFREGVVLRDSNATLHAAAGDYYSVERRAVFTGNVRVQSDSGEITARDLTYWRDSREAYAVGNVVLISTDNGARLTGDTLRHQPAIGYTMATGSPKLVKVDTAVVRDTTIGDDGDTVAAASVRRDTTTITARLLEAFRSDRNEYVATDSVRLRRGDLEAIGGLARFLQDEDVIALGPGGRWSRRTDSIVTGVPPRRDSLVAAGDSLGADGDKFTDAATRTGGIPPVVWYQGSQLTGDTITVGLIERKLRFIDVVGNAFAVSEGKLSGRYDQLAAVRLYFDVLLDTIRNVRAQGLASSIYFLYDSNLPSGVNRTSGDTINIAFANGQATGIGIIGRRSRAEGEYFPEHIVAGQETGYRLEGFRWIGRDGAIRQTGTVRQSTPAVPQGEVPPVDEPRSSQSRPRSPR